MRLKDLTYNELEIKIELISVKYRVEVGEINKKIIIDSLLTVYPNYLVVDFDKAFTLHSMGNLEAKEDKPYGELSCLFIGSVLKSFEDYKRKEAAKPKLKLPEQLEQLPPPTKDEEKEAFEFIKDVFMNEGRLPLIANWKEAVNYMTNENLIPNTKEYRQGIAKEVREEINKEIEEKRYKNQVYTDLIENLRNKTQFRNSCYRRIVDDYFSL